MLARMRKERISFTLLVGMQAGAASLENSMEVPQKIKNRTTLWPSNCTTRHLPKGTGVLFRRDTCTPMFIAALINNSQSMERAQMSLNGWMDKEDVVYIDNGVLLGNQKEWDLAFATMWMELEAIMLSEISQSEKDKNHMTSLIWGLQETKQMNIREGKQK